MEDYNLQFKEASNGVYEILSGHGQLIGSLRQFEGEECDGEYVFVPEPADEEDGEYGLPSWALGQILKKLYELNGQLETMIPYA
jgi:hypothetical protein